MSGAGSAVCRTCLSPQALAPLFPKPAQYRSFQLALRLCTGLQIKLNDGLPQTICKDCIKVVETAMIFRKQCRAAQVQLLQMNHKHKRISKSSAVNKEKMQKNSTQERQKEEMKKAIKIKIKLESEKYVSTEVLHLNIEPTSPRPGVSSDDDECLSKSFNLGKIKDEIKTETDIKKTKVEIDDEFNLDNRIDELDLLPNGDKKARLKVIEGRKRYLDLIEGPLDTTRPIQCKICKKFSKNMNSFEKHAMSHLGYPHLCEHCAKRFLTTGNMLRHMRAKHGLARDNSFPCSYCDYKAIDKEQLQVHERRYHTKERPFICDDCGAAFYSKRVLTQHRVVQHTHEKPFQCDKCPSKFKLLCHLTNHTNRVHSKKYVKYSYGCHICMKRYSSTVDVRKHLTKIHNMPVEQQGKIHRFYFDQPPPI